MTLPDDSFVQGESFQLQTTSGCQHVKLQCDPDGLILYWSGYGTPSEFLFFDHIVDVRVQRFLNENDVPFPLCTYSLTVVTSTDLVKVTEFVFYDIRKPIVDIWSDFILSWSLQSKRRFRGLLHHFKKALAPARFVISKERELLDIYTVADALLPDLRHSGPYIQLVNSLFSGRTFLKRKAIRKEHVTERNLSEMIIAAVELEQNALLLSYFHEVAGDNGKLTLEGLRLLWTQTNPARTNGARFSDSQIERIFEEFSDNREFIDFNGFLRLLVSDYATDLFSSDFAFNGESMNFPLSHYYVNTCVSNQNLFSSFDKADCSLEAYRQILLAGFRAIHIICHPHEGGEVVVRAGPSIAMVGGEVVPLEDFCEMIRSFAFRATEMPLIVHLEQHCTPAQQRKIAAVFVKVFGDALLRTPVCDPSMEIASCDACLLPCTPLPSPNSLKRKILISCKRKRSKSPASPSEDVELEDLCVYLNLENHSKKPGDSISTDHFELRSDSHILEKAKYGNWYVQHNNHNMTRIWPDGTVVGVNVSSELYWASGCQMVAMAILHPDLSRPLQLNQTLFEENGGCGFVLKPECLRNSEITVDYKGWTIPGVRSVRVDVEVLSAVFLSMLGVHKSMKMPSTQVQVDLYDTFNDHCVGKKRNRTTVVKHNTMNPAYVENPKKRNVFVFEKVIKPEFAFLHFTVITSSGKEIAQRFLPVHRIRQGLHFVILRGESNQWIGPAALLVRFSIR